MRKYLVPITVCAVVFGGQMAYGKPVTSMSMAGPYGTPAFGQVVSFDVTWENVLGKEWPLFAVNCFRDLNGDGVVTMIRVADPTGPYMPHPADPRAAGEPGRGIGLATSRDGGRTFAKYAEGPILDRDVVDPYFVANCCVLIESGVWRMWYLSCVGWERGGEALRHRYHIRYAESGDGIHWKRTGTVCIDFRSDDEYAISRPCVLKDGALYRMWYSYRGAHYRIGYAESKDGIAWERKDGEAGLDVSASGWASEMVEYPFVFDHGGTRYMLYNGNGYGKTGFGIAVED